jgi:hypothetical protein
MPEAGYETNGHLLVIVGFTADGDPILNDPASSSDANVRSVYTRENFEAVWQESTGGVSSVYHPSGRAGAAQRARRHAELVSPIHRFEKKSPEN